MVRAVSHCTASSSSGHCTHMAPGRTEEPDPQQELCYRREPLLTEEASVHQGDPGVNLQLHAAGGRDGADAELHSLHRDGEV